MRPAAVGFHCPECVREGARTTRSGRTAYGGRRPGDPSLTSKVIIGLNVLVWVLVLVTGASSSRLVDHLALRPASVFRGVDYPQLHSVVGGEVWQLVTSMFTHVSAPHIGFNMLALWVLGPQLEAMVGRARFLAIYLVSGLAGSAAVMWLSPSYQATLGASGAIFGLMGALLVVTVKARGDVRAMATWIGINLVFTFVFPGISWQGHLGGFAGGLLLGAVIVYAPRRRRTGWQTAGVTLVAVVVAVAIATRIAVLA
jgi:membrane associated rhomboid family serine protease